MQAWKGGKCAHLSRPQTRVLVACMRPPEAAAAVCISTRKRSGGKLSVWKASAGRNWRRLFLSYSWAISLPAASFKAALKDRAAGAIVPATRGP